jgi:shikimate kinase
MCTPETCVVFLEAPLEIMISRCEQQLAAAIRPVLNDRDRLRDRFESRLPHYRDAHLVVNTASLTPEETSRQIMGMIRSILKESTPA